MNIPIAGSNILIADDSQVSLEIMKRFLEKQGFSIIKAVNGREALEKALQFTPDLVILDISMPEMTGLEVCREIKNHEEIHFTPVIVLTNSESKEDKNLAISVGANDFLNKPFDQTELRLKVESLLKLKKAIDELENATNLIMTLAKAVEAKDKYTEGHIERVSSIGADIARRMSLSEQQIKDVVNAGILHDIGKIGTPDNILNKPDKLTDEEFEVIKQHPITGEEICMPIKSFANVRKIIRHHHEKLDGTGYPDGISGDDISIETRIIAVADIYDALTSNRPYRSALEESTAFRILGESVAKGEIDCCVVETLRAIVEG